MWNRYFLPLWALSFQAISQHVQSPLDAVISGSDCHNVCTQLAATLPDQVYYNPESRLEAFREQFYSTTQGDVIPACILTPSSGDALSQAIKLISQHQCIFAVKSGGHSMIPGASNAPSGITIDLSKFTDIVLDEEGLLTKVGTGNRWNDVYKALEPLNRTVVGGRHSGVGVGGFTLGGGISFISRRYGWALDNVRNFEVILANGTIANVNQNSAPDLYFALRGGGNNFGIVTNFELETHTQGQVWGGHKIWPINNDDISSRSTALGIPSVPFSWTPRYLLEIVRSGLAKVVCKLGYCVTIDKFLKIFEDVVMAEQGDEYAQMYVSIVYVAQLNMFIAVGALVYSKPVANPEVFKDFLNEKAPYSSLKIASYTEVHDEVVAFNEAGFRQDLATLTFKASAKLLSKIIDICLEELQPILNIKDILPAIVMQPINRDEIRLFGKNGGNCLGIDETEGPLILFSLAFRWSRPEDDIIVYKAVRNVIDRAMKLAKEMGLYHRYIYQNYANGTQDVIGSYGEENRQKLREIQTKYDPEGVFRRLQPGSFKI